MEKKYKITGRSQVFILHELGLSISIGLIIYYIIVLVRPDAKLFMIPFFVVGFIITQLVPVIFFHRRYYLCNRDTTLVVDSDTGTMRIEEGGDHKSFRFDQIRRVELVLNGDLFAGAKNALNVWGLYHYAALELDDGSRYIITCLLVNDLRKFFADLGIKVQKRKKALPWIKRDEISGQ